jgi:sensor histidine kinase regulating citrate/malate metabolism
MAGLCDGITAVGILLVSVGLWLLHPSAALIFLGLVSAALGLWGSWALARHRGSETAKSRESPRVAPLKASEPAEE